MEDTWGVLKGSWGALALMGSKLAYNSLLGALGYSGSAGEVRQQALNHDEKHTCIWG